LALMILDIDYFQAINDTYGHDAGDDVLANSGADSQIDPPASISPAAMAARNSSS